MTIRRSFSFRFPLIVLFALAVAVASCSEKGKTAAAKLKPGDPGVIAHLGDRYVIDQARFDAIQKELPAEAKASYSKRGSDAFLNDYLDRQLLVLEAEDRGLENDPAVAAKLEMSRGTILVQAVVEKFPEETIPEAEAKAYFLAHPAEFQHPETLTIRQIAVTPRKEEEVMNTDKDDAVDEATAKKKIEILAKRVKAGEDFVTLARRFGEDQSAQNGGLLRPFTLDTMPKAFADAVRDLRAGDTTGVVKSQFGYHVIRLEDRRGSAMPKFEDIKAVVVRTILERDPERQKKMFETRLAALKAKYPVSTTKPQPAGGSATASSASAAGTAQGK